MQCCFNKSWHVAEKLHVDGVIVIVGADDLSGEQLFSACTFRFGTRLVRMRVGLPTSGASSGSISMRLLRRRGVAVSCAVSRGNAWESGHTGLGLLIKSSLIVPGEIP